MFDVLFWVGVFALALGMLGMIFPFSNPPASGPWRPGDGA